MQPGQSGMRVILEAPGGPSRGPPRRAQAPVLRLTRGRSHHYLRFLDIAYGSTKELGYQASLAHRLGYLQAPGAAALDRACTETSQVLCGLIRSLRGLRGGPSL